MNTPSDTKRTQQLVSNQSKPPFNFSKLALSLSIAGWMAHAHASNTYTLIDIGINPTAINANGLIIGNNYFLYNPADASLTNIQMLNGGAALTTVNDINNLGQVAGIATNRAYARDTNGLGLDIGVLPGDATSSAYAGNDLGQVVGISAPSSATPCAVHGFLGIFSASGAQLKDLGSLGGARNYAFDINASGQVVGKSSYNPATDCSVTGSYHAYVTTSTGLYDLHGIGMLGNNSAAYKINDKGLVVGDFTNGLLTTATGLYYPKGYPINHAVLWNTVDNSYTDLGNGSKDSSLRAINIKGEMVGFERTFSTAYFSGVTPIISAQNAVVAYPGTGLIDLNTLVVNMPTGWSLRSAVDINDAGQIIGSARDSQGFTHGVLLTPSAPPPPVDVLPAAPTGLTATAISTTQISLSWTDNATNETGQTLERCQDAGCNNFTVIATLSAGVTSYSDANLSPSTSYSYRIKANASSGSSAYSNVLTTATLTPVEVLPAAPTGLTATAISTTQISLSWADNATNETGQTLERCKDVGCSNFTVIATLNAGVTSYNDTSLSPSTSYSYRIKANAGSSSSTYSNVLTTATLTPIDPATLIPAAPTNLTSVAISKSMVTLNWTDNATNEQNYLIERCKGQFCTAFSFLARKGANTVSFTNSSLSNKTYYRYRIRAANAAGNSSYSNITTVKTLS